MIFIFIYKRQVELLVLDWSVECSFDDRHLLYLLLPLAHLSDLHLLYDLVIFYEFSWILQSRLEVKICLRLQLGLSLMLSRFVRSRTCIFRTSTAFQLVSADLARWEEMCLFSELTLEDNFLLHLIIRILRVVWIMTKSWKTTITLTF